MERPCPQCCTGPLPSGVDTGDPTLCDHDWVPIPLHRARYGCRLCRATGYRLLYGDGAIATHKTRCYDLDLGELEVTVRQEPCATHARTSPNNQPFRAGDTVEVLLGASRGERWVVAVYEADKDIAMIAGWPCTMVTRATEALKLVTAATDSEHEGMIISVARVDGDDPRKWALRRVVAAGGMP